MRASFKLKQSKEHPVQFNDRLMDRIRLHQENLRVLVPDLSVMDDDKVFHQFPVALPSSFTDEERQSLDIAPLIDVEVDLRIGHAHDVLERLRQALGLKSFLIQESQQTRAGNRSEEYDRHDPRTRAEHKVKHSWDLVQEWVQLYNTSWNALCRLGVDERRMCGLRELKDKDLIMLGGWIQEQRYKTGSSNGEQLPWIWRLSPLSSTQEVGELSQKVASWNEEGEIGCFLCLLFDV